MNIMLKTFITIAVGICSSFSYSLFAPSDSELRDIRELHDLVGMDQTEAKSKSDWQHAYAQCRASREIENLLEIPSEKEGISIVICLEELKSFPPNESDDHVLDDLVYDCLRKVSESKTKFTGAASELLEKFAAK